MQSDAYIAITIILMIMVIVAIVWRQRQAAADRVLNRPSSPASHSSIKADEQAEQKRRLLFIALGLLVFAGLVVYFEFSGKAGSDDNSSMAAFVPIWIAIWIPFISKKRRQADTNVQKKFGYVAAAMALAILVGLVVFLLARS